ncbi:alpha-amylase family glycosyl hydrolase [soil metagenome]
MAGLLGLVMALSGSAGQLSPAANVVSASHTAEPVTVTVVGSLQSELGCAADWDPGCLETRLGYDADDDVWQGSWEVPAGNHEYKVALNNSWDENYGAGAQFNGPDITLSLSATTSVKFYYDHKSHWVTDNHNTRIVTAAGSFQSELGCPGDWQPDCLRSWLQDPDCDGTFTFSTTALPEGPYEAKATINESWDENYGAGGVFNGDNIAFTVHNTGDLVTFSFVSATNVLAISAPGGGGAGHDNDIWWDDLGHDSRDPVFRNLGGAVPAGTPVTLRLRAASGDLTAARVRIWDDRNDAQMIVPMTLAADDGTHEWWEATVTPGQPTIYWYRFIALDGTATAFYEDDEALTGGLGQTYGSSTDRSWQLSVHDPAFQSPEWVKNAVIYQIFPDRFRDGDPTNNPAPGQCFYGETPTVYRSFGEDWHTPICDPRASGPCAGVWSQNFYGGDLAGILEKLDYLEDLGVTALYLNPIFRSPSNHKYDTTDFTEIDPAFGDLALFEQLSTSAQQRGMRPILDGVFNHSSSDSIYFDRYGRYDSVGACESQTSAYRDWYHFNSVPAGTGACVGDDGTPAAANYESWFGFDSLPKLDSANEAVRDFFYQGGVSSVGPYWLSWADGWRLDVAGDVDPGLTNDPSNDYWEGFRDAVRAANPEAYIVGEEWGLATAWTLGGEWDATMNYQLSSALLSFYRDTPFVDNDHNVSSSAGVLNPIAPSQLAERILNLEERYPQEAFLAVMNLLGSHDTNRPLFMLDHNADQNQRSIYEDPNYDWSDAIARLRGVALLQSTLPGAPTVYYGDEVGLVAPPTYDGSTWQDDPYNRIPYPWLDETGTPYYPHLQTSAGQAQLLDHYTLLLNTRNSHPALRTGSLDILLTDDEAGTFAYGRRLANQGDAAVVVVNRSGSAQSVDFDVAGYLPVGAQFQDVLNGGSYVVDASGQLSLSVPANGGALLVLSGSMAAPPAGVTDLNVTAERSGEIELAWTASSGADSYDVYRGLLSGGGYELVANTTSTGFTNTGLQNGLAYYYVVVARDDGTLLISDQSNEVSGTPQLDLSDSGSSWFNLQWPPTLSHTISTTNRTDNIYGQIWVSGVTEAEGPADGIRAQVGYGPEGTQPNGSWTWAEMVFNAQVGNNDEYTGSLLPTTTGVFHYAVRYSGDGGQTWWLADLNGPQRSGTLANPGVLTVSESTDTTPPTTPELSLGGVTASSISLSWTASEDETELAGYELFRDGAKIAQLGASATSYVDESVTTGTTYTYYVQAFDTSFNRSQPSNEVQATAENLIVQVTFKVAVPPYTPADATVYVTGSINQLGPWNPGAFPMTLDPSDGTWSTTFASPDGTNFEWKYTRGSWETVEQWGSIAGIANRGPTTVSYGTDGTMLIDNTATSGPDSFQAVGDWRDPLVVSHSPADDAANVALDATIGVEWSKPMQPSASFSVSGPDGAVAGTFAPSDGDRTVTFTPDEELVAGATYEVLVSGQTSAGGDQQQVPVAFSFSTAEDEQEAVLESITISPADHTLRVGQRQTFSATGHYSDGSSQTLSGVSWQSSNTRVLSINASGTAQARGPGSVQLSATLDGVSGQTSVTVTAARP